MPNFISKLFQIVIAVVSRPSKPFLLHRKTWMAGTRPPASPAMTRERTKRQNQYTCLRPRPDCGVFYRLGPLIGLTELGMVVGTSSDARSAG
jgi:hypothetical protein